MKLIDIIQGNLNLNLEEIKVDHELILDIQIKLAQFGLYPSGRWLDGEYGEGTNKALERFSQVMNLESWKNKEINVNLAQTLLNTNITSFRFETAKNKDQVFKEFSKAQPHPQTGGGVYLDRGFKKSLYRQEITSFPDRLKIKPDDIEIISPLNPKVKLFPNRGKQPEIDEDGLNFLHRDITEACVCVGAISEGKLHAQWFGRNALDNEEFWSDTKIIPIINLVCQLNQKYPHIDIDKCIIRSANGNENYDFNRLVVATISYNFNPSSSNRIAAMFKRFSTYEGLEKWLQRDYWK